MEPTPGASNTADKEDAASRAEEVKPAASSAAEAKQPTQEVEDFPDPDEDDLDDLDDMLDDFSAVKVDGDAKKPAEPAPKTEPAPEPDLSGEGLPKEFQEGLESLLGELGNSPDMAAQFEQMLKGMADEAGKPGGGIPGFPDIPAPGPSSDAPQGSTTSGPAPSGVDPAADASFQETIRRTMERMQTSGDQATAAASSGGADDFMSEMLKQMSSGDFNGEGGEEEFSKMLMGMMEQLTTKEILYEPMKELNEKFPAWLDKNRDATPQEDLKRYDEQRNVVAEIVARFEQNDYSDSSAADREYIVERMQKMQAAGSPPSDLVGDMESAQEAFNATDEQCNPQ